MTIRYLLVLLLLASSFSVLAENKAFHQLEHKPRLVQLEIQGLHRTREIVVRRELLFREGDYLTTRALMQSVQNLKNLQLFSYVRPFLELQAGNKVKLILSLQEKWTTIPFMSYRQGGGTRFFYFGLYDINTWGRYIEAGFQYENWNGEHGGMLWFRNPRFLHKRSTLGINLWSTQKPTFLYDRDGKDQGSYILKQQQINFSIKKELRNVFEFGLLLEYSKDKLHSLELTPALDDKTRNTIRNHRQVTTLLNTLTLRLGKLNYDIDIVSGRKTELLLSHSEAGVGSDESFNKLKWVNQYYWQLPRRSYIATNFTLAATDTPLLQEYYFVGGFEHIRGYLAGQFRDKAYWQFNAEYRIPSYRSPWIILQHIFFLDAVNSAASARNLNKFDNNVYSAGIGVRLISPRIYKFNGRLDFALLTSDKSQISLSFGTHHFF